MSLTLSNKNYINTIVRQDVASYPGEIAWSLTGTMGEQHARSLSGIEKSRTNTKQGLKKSSVYMVNRGRHGLRSKLVLL